MNREKIIRLAKEAGCIQGELAIANVSQLERFAELVAAAEREACALVAWLHYMDTCKKHGHGSDVEKIRDFCAAAAIRAGGDSK